MVLSAARQQDTTTAQGALNQLCALYWRPLYFYLRRQGYSEPDAKDLTQGFFHHLLASDFLKQADPDRGRFRSFLLSSLNNFVANHWARERAQKRGGDCQLISLDFDSAETHYRLEPATNTSPETLYDRKWAVAILDRTLNRLQAEYNDHGKGDLFETLKDCLAGKSDSAPYRELGQKLKMSEGAIKVAVHRLRTRYRELLREEISQTLDNPAEVENELRHLFQTLSL